MRRFRREGRYHYGSTGTQRLHARRRTCNLAMARHNTQDEADNSGTTDSGVYTVVDKGDNGHFGYGAIFKVTFGVINEPGSHEPGTENLLEPGLSDTAIETMIKTIKNLVTIVKNDKTGTLMGFGEPGSLEPGVPASFNEPGGEILSSEPGNEPGEDKIPISNETTIVKDLMDLLIVTNNNTTWAINNTNNTNAINS